MRQRLGPLNIFWLFISLPPPSYEFRPGVLLNSALCVPEARVYACVYVYVCEFVCVCVCLCSTERESSFVITVISNCRGPMPGAQLTRVLIIVVAPRA